MYVLLPTRVKSNYSAILPRYSKLFREKFGKRDKFWLLNR